MVEVVFHCFSVAYVVKMINTYKNTFFTVLTTAENFGRGVGHNDHYSREFCSFFVTGGTGIQYIFHKALLYPVMMM